MMNLYVAAKFLSFPLATHTFNLSQLKMKQHNLSRDYFWSKSAKCCSQEVFVPLNEGKSNLWWKIQKMHLCYFWLPFNLPSGEMLSFFSLTQSYEPVGRVWFSLRLHQMPVCTSCCGICVYTFAPHYSDELKQWHHRGYFVYTSDFKYL